MKTDVILVGGFHEIIELCQDCGYNIIGIIDNEKEGQYYNIPILGKDSDASFLYNEHKRHKIIVTPDTPSVRRRLVELYQGIGYEFISLISPKANISRYASIGKGTVIQAGVNVSTASKVGDFCKLNTNCNIMHDNIIDNFVTIAPNAVSLGYVNIEEAAYIGANSTILPKLRIGHGSVVGANAVVTKDVLPGQVVKGNPAK